MPKEQSLSEKIVKVVGGDGEGLFVKDLKQKLQEAKEELKEKPYDRETYIEQWKEHFFKLNRRKPNRQEIMCFKVGFNGGINLIEDRIDKIFLAKFGQKLLEDKNAK